MVFLCASWIAIALLINPTGDFPLNDDWSFGLPVEHLVTNGDLRFTNWQSQTLIGQVLWGAAFCLPDGFSFTALRISTLAIGLLGVLAVYGLARELKASHALAVAAAMLVALNPIYLGLSYSFMSDVPFAAALAGSVYFLARGLSTDRASHLLAGLALAGYSVSIRQFGMAIFLGFAVASFTKWGPSWRWIKWAVVPIVVAAMSLVAYSLALRYTGRLPDMYGQKTIGAVVIDLAHFRLGAIKVPLRVMLISLMYLGLFTLPFQALVVPPAVRSWSRSVLVWATGVVSLVAVAITWLLAHFHWLMPMTGNIVVDFGLGLRDAAGPVPHGASTPFWIAVTLSAAVGLCGLGAVVALSLSSAVAQCARFQKLDATDAVKVFLAATCLIYVLPLAMMYDLLFDRYLLPILVVLPALLLGASRSTDVPKSAWLLFTVTLSALGIFAVASTHDLLDWNRARAVAFNELTERRGIDVEETDAGFALNNLLPNRKRMQEGGVDGLVDRSKARYIICQALPTGYRAISEFDCHPWLPYAIEQLWIAEREPPTQ